MQYEDGSGDDDEFLETLIVLGFIEGGTVDIAKQVIQTGYESLTPPQKTVFDREITAAFPVESCARCGDDVSLSATHIQGDDFCDYCRYIWDKEFNRDD